MKRNILFFILIIGGLLLAACGNEASGKDKPRKIKVAYEQATKPITYTDENGEATGYDVEILKEVAKRLPQYEFEFIGTTDDDLIIGVEQGKFQLGVKNAFFTEERAKKFIYPQEFIGLSSTGLILKKENDHIKNLEDFAKEDLSLAPIAANNAQYTVIENYNNEHPDQPVNLVAGDVFSIDVVQWVLEDRADGAVTIEGIFNNQVLAEGAPYEHLQDQVIYQEFDVIKTWPLFNKKEQELADAFDEALKEVKAEGIPSKLSEQFYGKDLFKLLKE